MCVTPNENRLFGCVDLLFEIRYLNVKDFLKQINLTNTFTQQNIFMVSAVCKILLTLVFLAITFSFWI